MAKKRSTKKSTKLRRSGSSKRRRAARDKNRPNFEALEPKQLLAAVTVGNAIDLVNAPDTSSIAALIADDGGDGISLREAITAANNTTGGDDISFSASLSGSTISLGGMELAVSDSLVIDGTNLPAGLTIDAQSNSRVINFTAASGDLTLSGLAVTGGRIVGAGEDGAGIRFGSDGTLALQEVTVAGNRTDGSGFADGGGIHAATGNVSLQGSTISGNRAASNGGGVYVSAGNLSVVNSTVSGNQASGSFGGGIFAGGTLTVESSTIVRNQLGSNYGFGGGIRGSGTINNSIVAENSDNPSPGEDSAADLLGNFSGNFNLVGIGDSVSGNNNQTEIVSASLGDLAHNGGPTQTHALLPGSLAIDAGHSTLNVDQRGVARLRDDPNIPNPSGGNASDIGAFEFQDQLGFIVTTASDVVDAADNLVSLREAVALSAINPGADLITFDSSLSGQTIALTGGQLDLTSDVNIDGDTDGDDRADITISGNNNSRIFDVTGFQTDVDLESLNLIGGNAISGGAIRSRASSLDIRNSTISGNSASINGGGIATYNVETRISSSLITGNTAASDGGGIYVYQTGVSGMEGGNLSLVNSTVHGNQADKGGGIAISSASRLHSTNSTITGNHASTEAGGVLNTSFLSAYNTVIAENTSGTGGDPRRSRSFRKHGSNDVGA